MTDNINKNAGMQQKNTETDKGNILVVTEMKFLDFGIQYFFKPLQKKCLLVPLENIKRKDLVSCLFYGTRNLSSVVFHTSNTYHRVYEDALSNQTNEDIVRNIYQVGDEFLKIVDM